MKSILTGLMVGVLSVSLIACQTSATPLVTSLNAVADAASVAVVAAAAFEAAGKLSPATATEIENLSSAVHTSVLATETELATTDTNIQKITVITQDFQPVLKFVVTGPDAVLLQAVVVAVTTTAQLFLGQLNSTPVLMAAKLAPKAPIKLTHGDKVAMKAMNAKLVVTAAQAAKLKKK